MASGAQASPSPLALATGAPLSGRFPLPLRLTPSLGASLVGNDGASLLANDGASIVGSGGGNLIANDGASLIANDGGSLIANDGAAIVGSGGGNIVGSGGGNILAGGAGNRRLLGGSYALAQADTSPDGLAAGRLRRRLWEVNSLLYVFDQTLLRWAQQKPVPGRWTRLSFQPKTLPNPETDAKRQKGRLDPALVAIFTEAFESLAPLDLALRLKPKGQKGWELEVQRLPKAGGRLREGKLLGRFLVAENGDLSFRMRLKGLRSALEEAGELSGNFEGSLKNTPEGRVLQVDRPEQVGEAALTERGKQFRFVLGMEPSVSRLRLRITMAKGKPAQVASGQVRRYTAPDAARRFRRAIISAQVSALGAAFWERKSEGATADSPWVFVDRSASGSVAESGQPPGFFLDAKGDWLAENEVPATLLDLLPGRSLLEDLNFLPAFPLEGEDPNAEGPDFLPEASISQADDAASE